MTATIRVISLLSLSLFLLLSSTLPLCSCATETETETDAASGAATDHDNEVTNNVDSNSSLNNINNNSASSSSSSSTSAMMKKKDPSDIKLGLINGGSDFFKPIEEGFLHQCKVLQIGKCYVGVGTHQMINNNETCDPNCSLDYYIQDFVYNKGVDEIIMKPHSGGDGDSSSHIHARNVLSRFYTMKFDKIPNYITI